MRVELQLIDSMHSFWNKFVGNYITTVENSFVYPAGGQKKIIYFFITIVFYNFFMERCTQISRLRDNKVLLYCIVSSVTGVTFCTFWT